MLKKISLALLGLTANSMALAGAMGPVCLPGNVTTPCVEDHWEFGVQALYLAAGFETQNAFNLNDILSPTTKRLSPLPPFGVIDPTHRLNKSWNWGSLLEGAYHFNTGNDITINWLHYNNSVTDDWTTSRVLDPSTSQLLAQAVIDVDTLFNFYGVNRFDEVNLEMGQLTNFGQSDKLRFYGGLQYAHVAVDADNFLNSTVMTQARVPPLAPAPSKLLFQISLGTFNNRDYKGIGPVVGIDYAYYLTPKLSVTANSYGSILYGPSRIEAGVLDAAGTVLIAAVSNRLDTMVPTLHGEFGLNYAYNMPQGQLNLQVGYLALNYFNVLQTQPIALSGAITTNDYSLYGPYAGISYIGSV